MAAATPPVLNNLQQDLKDSKLIQEDVTTLRSFLADLMEKQKEEEEVLAGMIIKNQKPLPPRKYTNKIINNAVNKKYADLVKHRTSYRGNIEAADIDAKKAEEAEEKKNKELEKEAKESKARNTKSLALDLIGGGLKGLGGIASKLGALGGTGKYANYNPAGEAFNAALQPAIDLLSKKSDTLTIYDLNREAARETDKLLKLIGAENAPEWAKINLMHKIISTMEKRLSYAYSKHR
jgi:hypothetical protein